MTNERFNKILEQRIESINSVLASKAKEYAVDGGDRLHNFKVASRIGGHTPERALKGMFMKHLVSVFDIIDNLDKGIAPTVLNEKVGDAINYMILLEALLKERTEFIIEKELTEKGIVTITEWK